jgi:hypothetical protein
MERYCSTGQSPQRAVAPTEEEEEEEEEVTETGFLHFVRKHTNRNFKALESGSTFKQAKFFPLGVFACFI